jgi:hypothetical protein
VIPLHVIGYGFKKTRFAERQMDKMQIFKNKASGKCFVYVEDNEEGKALFILPRGEVKCLKLDLFEHPKEDQVESFLARGLITEEQSSSYQKLIDTLEL